MGLNAPSDLRAHFSQVPGTCSTAVLPIQVYIFGKKETLTSKDARLAAHILLILVSCTGTLLLLSCIINKGTIRATDATRRGAGPSEGLAWSGAKQENDQTSPGHRTPLPVCVCVCVCVCVFSSHSFWTSSSLDVPVGVTQDFSSTFLRCVPSFLSREGFSHSFPLSTVKSNFVY